MKLFLYMLYNINGIISYLTCDMDEAEMVDDFISDTNVAWMFQRYLAWEMNEKRLLNQVVSTPSINT